MKTLIPNNHWRPGNNGGGKRKWFCWRPLKGGGDEYLRGQLGRIRRFESYETTEKICKLTNESGE